MTVAAVPQAAIATDAVGGHNLSVASIVGFIALAGVAAPMVGGMISAPLLSMFVIPATYLLMNGRRLPPAAGSVLTEASPP